MKTVLTWVLWIAAVICPGIARADYNCLAKLSSVTLSVPTSVTLTVGSDPPAPGTPLTDWFEGVDGIFDCEPNPGQVYVVFASSGAPPVAGVALNEPPTAFPVFSTGIPGVGVVMGYSSTGGKFQPPGTSTDGAVFASSQVDFVAEVHWKIRLVATGRLEPGRYSRPQQRFGSFSMMHGGQAGTVDFLLGALHVEVMVTSCAPLADDTSVSLRTVSRDDFSGKNSVQSAGAFTFSVACSGATDGVEMYATFTDPRNPSYTGTNISLTADSAWGVGLQLWKDGRPLRLGTSNRWFVGTVDGTLNVPLHAYYVQTEKAVGTGPVDAAITFTLSYP